MTIWTLFSDDIKMLTTDKSADTPFSIIVIILQTIFLTELILSSICLDKYFLGFFFWLDLIATVSMLMDIHWVYNIMIEGISDSFSTTKGIGTTSRTVKVGTRAARLFRILRIIKVVRLVKIYKLSQNFKIKKEVNLSDSVNIRLYENKEDFIQENSKIGRRLSEATMKKLIFMVMAMIVGIVVLNPNLYFQSITSMEQGIRTFADFDSISDPNLVIHINLYIDKHKVSLKRS